MTAAPPVSAVTLAVEDAVAWITLNRPRHLNALSPELISALDDVVAQVEVDPRVRAVVITGSGRAFSAGGDLTSFREWVEQERYDDIVDAVARSATVLRRIERLRQPVIAAVNGIAVAGGLELILCCDLVVAVAGTKIGDGHITYCILPGGGGSVRLARKVPPALAKRLLLTGDLLAAEDLVPSGLVTHVVGADTLAAEARRMATALTRLSPVALAAMKTLADQATAAGLDDALTLELETFAAHVRSDDFREGVCAFTQKRPPCYQGR